jgi:hypothetical protein
VLPDDPDGEFPVLPPAVEPSAPTALPAPHGLSVALRGRIPAAALARGTEPPAGRVPAPPHSAAIGFGPGAGLVVAIAGDRVTLSTPSGQIVGTRAQTRDLIDALLEALTR